MIEQAQWAVRTWGKTQVDKLCAGSNSLSIAHRNLCLNSNRSLIPVKATGVYGCMLPANLAQPVSLENAPENDPIILEIHENGGTLAAPGTSEIELANKFSLQEEIGGQCNYLHSIVARESNSGSTSMHLKAALAFEAACSSANDSERLAAETLANTDCDLQQGAWNDR